MGKYTDWVASIGGNQAVAKALGKKLKTVQHWSTGYSSPKTKDAEKLIKLANGKLTLSDINDARKKS